MMTTDGQTPGKVAERLGDDEIHVWRLAYDHHRGRAPLIWMLAAYLGVPAEAVQLEESDHGRPMLADPHRDAFAFNWSHSHDQALIAIARGVAPGVDLERLRPHPKAVPIARRYFSPDEAAWLEGVPATQRDRAFLDLWTAKEAVLKALGRGLAFGLHRLSIAGSSELPILGRLEGHEAGQWQLHRLALDEEHVGTLAWHGEPRHVRLWTLADPA
ncbi:MAG TPA: 4'-phosphopantetheinyl transferase superfamily protein [Dyella sp.]|uniref:4'-phosphopantetheinyl transferase family protein n=1 Tax=Dyella sp. TaxID=1869338 RepID=UPI002D775D7F|nr:4'-phosphopantetheinyl transferase superfamily protein [Dyella sp.]HET6554060.1 4'-phosphopantetheinyl transferase superfamily protein [Dyella sp.]